jgi:glycosyltransferase involved in cell wall biosynthesis
MAKITYLCNAHNEENRIPRVIENALLWADEVLIADCGSTDNTVEVCKSYPGVRILENATRYQYIEGVNAASYDWVYVATPSEMPTRKLIEQVKIMAGMDYDLVTVPRRMYMLGVNSPNSPWYVSNYKYLINRTRTDISQRAHRIFSAKNGKEGHIPYSEDCCVYHLTYTDCQHWLDTMRDYWEIEVEQSNNPAADINACIQSISRYDKRLADGGDDLLLLRLGWTLYHMGQAFLLEEKRRGMDIKSVYSDIYTSIEREWHD